MNALLAAGFMTAPLGDERVSLPGPAELSKAVKLALALQQQHQHIVLGSNKSGCHDVWSAYAKCLTEKHFPFCEPVH